MKEAVVRDQQGLSRNAMNRDSLVKAALAEVNSNTSQARRELERVQKKFNERQQEQLELVRLLSKNTRRGYLPAQQ
jgi:ABC-type transporter Mla subunit MlaD